MFKAQIVVQKILQKLAEAGVNARVRYASWDDNVVIVTSKDPKEEIAARDALGFDSFKGFIDGIEVIIV